MADRVMHRWTAAACAALALAPAPGIAQQPPRRELVPTAVPLGEAARKAIDSPALTDDERKDLRVFHGVWDDRDLDTPARQALVALNAWDFAHPSLRDPATPVELRAQALYAQGQCQAAIELLAEVSTMRASRIRAEALEELGRLDDARAAVEAPVRTLLRTRVNDPTELTDAVASLYVRSRIEGQPARDFQSMMDLLGRAHQELDRLHWPAMLLEARLLLDKDNPGEAVAALHAILALNPRCAEAWYELGLMAAGQFDFESARQAAEALRRIDRRHPLADLLGAEASLVQDDPALALALLEPLVERWPELRPGLALLAAAQARRYDEAATAAALARYDELSPGGARALYAVGRHLAMDRQYPEAAAALEQAVARQSAWPAPQIELGLLEMQSGRERNALRALERVATLDPFNKRAANSLHLLRELAAYAQIDTEHFQIRYKPGPDEVAAEMMPEVLERMHQTVAGRFQHQPDRKTVIQLLPDHPSFSVRITGMPWVHTVAACTGPVIAMEASRDGPPRLHLGTFDWPRVIQHEYTHTITLSQTRNRIPHWLTEAAAVSMELAPRDYDRCVLLAQAWRDSGLFSLDEINWAFIRPRKPSDRALAYAQGHWMVEFMNERFGESALVRLINRYFHGEREEQALNEALGVSRQQFFADFLQWAGRQVASWGMDARPRMVELMDALRQADPELSRFLGASKQARLDAIARALADRIGAPASRGRERFVAAQWPPLVRPPVAIDDDTLVQWRRQYPDHPDVLETDIRRRLERREAQEPRDGDDDGSLIALLERYATVRPVDPFPDRKLAQLYLAGDQPERAIPHLERLDAQEQKSPVYTVELARAYRAAGRLDDALAKATRALQISPYQPSHRELAAAIAVQAGKLEVARRHIRALGILEPDQPQHVRRLERIEQMIQSKASP